MRTHARSLSALASAFLLGASATILSGCGKPEAPPAKVTSQACMGPATTVTVFVEWNGSVAKTRNKTVYLCEGKDSVEWISCEGDFAENFSWKTGSPFEVNPKHETLSNNKRVLMSKPSKTGTGGSGFDYTLDFLPPGGGAPVPIDPRIVILP